MERRTLRKIDLAVPITYADPDAPIDRIKVVPLALDAVLMSRLYSELEALEDAQLLAEIAKDADRVKILSRDIIGVKADITKRRSAVCEVFEPGSSKELEALLAKRQAEARELSAELADLQKEYSSGCPVDIRRQRELMGQLKTTPVAIRRPRIQTERIATEMKRRTSTERKLDLNFRNLERLKDKTKAEAQRLIEEMRKEFQFQKLICETLLQKIESLKKKLQALQVQISRYQDQIRKLEEEAKEATCCSTQVHEI